MCLGLAAYMILLFQIVTNNRIRFSYLCSAILRGVLDGVFLYYTFVYYNHPVSCQKSNFKIFSETFLNDYSKSNFLCF